MSSGHPAPESIAPPKHWGGRDKLLSVFRSRAFRWGAPSLLLLGIGAAMSSFYGASLEMDNPWGETSGTLTHLEEENVEATSPEEQRIAEARATAIADARACQAKIDEAMKAPALPGAPGLEAVRARLLARAKAEPVVFVDVPKYTGEVSRGTDARRKSLLTTRYPRDLMLKTIATFRDFPERLRDLVLRDGYIYAEDARAARVMIRDLKLDLLFHEDEVMMQRGSLTFKVKKGEDGLFYVATGPEKGERARLLMFDRVWLPGQKLGPPLHLDVRELARKEGTEGMKVHRITEDAVVADMRFEHLWAPALLKREGPHVELDCVLAQPEVAKDINLARDAAHRRALVLKSLREAIARQVELGLPFDEPRTERGQQDGKLRERWEKSYFSGRKAYRFNGDLYRVFSPTGAPLTPQVCIDFVTETLERASGMHFTPEGVKPQKVLGALDFDETLGYRRRQELAIRHYAKTNPDKFSIIDYPQSQWVRYEKIDRFFGFLEDNRDDLRSGDIVIIRGRAPWDRYEEIHTHTFFIYESDPVTGMPMLLAGNAGKPRITTWDSEMLRAPKRSIRHRIRSSTLWLYDHVVHRRPGKGERWATPLTVVEDRE